jgi:glycosyltransferase involved in cell wall biosynthesis
MVVLQLGAYPPPHGGVQTNLVAIREHVRRRGGRAPVINLTRHRRPSADDVYYPRSAFEVIRLLNELPADIIHVHIGGHLSRRLLALCLACSLIPARRVVLTFHSGGYPSGSGGMRARPRSTAGFVLRRLDAIIAVNPEIAALFLRFGVDPSSVHVICPYAPVSVAEGVSLPESLRAFQRAHAPMLTTVGLLEPEYDLALQIRTLAAVRQRFPDAGLMIIGSGSLRPDLIRFVEGQEHGSHVLLCGDVAHDQTLRAIAGSDVFLRTTRYDGDSVSVREALELGVPVIATDNGMRPPGVVLIPPASEVALSGAIERVLREPIHIARASDADRNHIEDVMSLYESLAGRASDWPRPALPTAL